MRRNRAILLLLSATIAVSAFLILRALEKHVIAAQRRAGAFMALYQYRRTSTRFTLQLNHHIPPGHWPGIKPGWVIEYRNVTRAPAAGGGVVYFADLSGEFLHSEHPGWLKALEKHENGIRPN